MITLGLKNPAGLVADKGSKGFTADSEQAQYKV
jgi:hypothetical protein